VDFVNELLGSKEELAEQIQLVMGKQKNKGTGRNAKE
jgi:hypothetical protein